mgnify:CR=1 FL=1
MAFGISSGVWFIQSEKDPRWNASGEEKFLSVTTIPDAAKQHLEKCKRLYGEKPDDLKYSCMKD